MTTHAYSGLGDRLQETRNPLAGTGGVTTTYMMDLASNLPQVLDDGTTTYTYGMDRISQTTSADTEYFLGDALGSVRQLADAGGAIRLDRNYDPFGNVITNVGSATSIYGFTGEQQKSGLVFLRARYYDPEDGRFLTKDTWHGDLYKPLSLNAWNYVEGNPILYHDTTGHSIGGKFIDWSFINIPITCPLNLIVGFFSPVVSWLLPVHYEEYGGSGAIVGNTPDEEANRMVTGYAAVLAGGDVVENSSGDMGITTSGRQSAGNWIQRDEYMSNAARSYQEFISGRSDGSVYELNGYTFDGFDASSGTLMDAKDIPSNFVDSATGEFKPWVSGTNDWLAQAKNQINAAGGLKIQWFFSTEAAKNAMYNLFLKNNPDFLKSIELIYKAPK